MKPQPTEYRGIRFRSKSEARLALYLDHLKKHWWYEPSVLRLSDGYAPDFLVFEIDEHYQAFHFQIVEFKPSRPTDTYVDELGHRMKLICDKFMGHPILDFLSGGWHFLEVHLIVGGMGYQEAQHNTFVYSGPEENEAEGWIFSSLQTGWPDDFGGEKADEINRSLNGYRFDLESS